MTLANSMILVDQTAVPLATPAFNGHGGEILLQARIEPDTDNDGFGDEMQDDCPARGIAEWLPGGVVEGLQEAQGEEEGCGVEEEVPEAQAALAA